MERVEEVVTAYVGRAGGVPPKPGTDGSYVLNFDDKYRIEVRPEGRDGLMLRSDLPSLKLEQDRQDALARLLRINLALSGRLAGQKRATLTLDRATDVPFLYDTVTVNGADIAASFKPITAFVNEVAAFHAALSGRH